MKEGILDMTEMEAILTNRFFDFIESSPTAFHTVNAVRALLLHAGFIELTEQQPWELQAGQGYFTTRSMSSILAFRCPKKDFRAFSVAAPHGDSLCFQVKAAP